MGVGMYVLQGTHFSSGILQKQKCVHEKIIVISAFTKLCYTALALHNNQIPILEMIKLSLREFTHKDKRLE